MPVPLPFLKAQRFSHSLERAGQEWLSAGLAMGARACEKEGAAGNEAGGQLGIPARMGLPAGGAETVPRGCQVHQLMGAQGGARGLGLLAPGAQAPNPGGGQALSTP